MNLLVALAAIILLAGCSSPGPSSSPASRQRSSHKFGTGDAQTLATAVEIRTLSEAEGIILERDWIEANYPGYTIQRRELVERLDRAYDMITVFGPGNTMRTLYFDISAYRRPDRNGDLPRPF